MEAKPEGKTDERLNDLILESVKSWAQNGEVSVKGVITIEQAVLIEQLRVMNSIRRLLSFIVFIFISGIIGSFIIGFIFMLIR